MQPPIIRSTDNPIVYVVDDDPDVRGGLRDVLQSVGLKVEVFGSAAEWLANKLPEQVSCLVLDVRLPGLSGLDLQAELAAAQIKVPVIFITGHGDIPMTVKAMRAGAMEFLTKPVGEQDLLDAVRAALNRDRSRREYDQETHELRTRFGALSTRERQIMALVTSGLMNKRIAGEIGLSEVTVKVHRHNVMKKVGARSLADLVRIADLLNVSQNRP